MSEKGFSAAFQPAQKFCAEFFEERIGLRVLLERQRCACFFIDQRRYCRSSDFCLQCFADPEILDGFVHDFAADGLIG